MSDARREATPFERAFYGEGVEIHAPANLSELRSLLEHAREERRPVVPAGAGAHAWAADPPPENALVISARAFDSIVNYEPDDFTIGVGSGLSLAELTGALRRHGQEIPIDLPRTLTGTAGGLVARAPSGPRRARYGALSSFLLGVEGVRGGGAPFKAGGMVVKNVAGYPIGKLAAGSFGRIGVLARVNFKLRPVPERRHVRRAAFARADDAWEFVSALRRSILEPASLAVLSGEDPHGLSDPGLPPPNGPRVVAWTFEGSAATVSWLASEAEKIERPADAELAPPLSEDEAAEHLPLLVERGEPDASIPNDLGVVRLCVLPGSLGRLDRAVCEALPEGFRGSLTADATSGLLTVRWRGEPERVSEPLAPLASAAHRLGGTAQLEYLPPAKRREWKRDLSEDPNAALAARVLDVFDPAGSLAAARPLGKGPLS